LRNLLSDKAPLADGCDKSIALTEQFLVAVAASAVEAAQPVVAVTEFALVGL
jgi:hypothetical protein